MPIVKHIAVHTHPFFMLQYILNGEKNDEMKYATGLNCSADTECAYEEFKSNFELFSGERFYKRSFDFNDGEAVRSKEKIRLHHYIQSFAPGEITPEEAHKIGVEWAKRVFGNDRQVLISTHLDRGHIHNHCAVAPYDVNGKKWYANKSSLKRCRDISDRLAAERGYSVIENPKYKADKKYSDWLARQQNTSWKTRICDDIDKLVLREDVKSVNDLAEQLRQMGYTVSLNKYMAIKTAPNRKAVRSFRLGDGYAVEELQYRIENKNREISLSAIADLSGIQREYALCLRELQITFYRKPDRSYRAAYRELRQNADLLTYLCNNKIQSVADFENKVNSAAEKTDEIKNRKNGIKKEIRYEEKLIEEVPIFLELDSKPTLNSAEIQRLRELRYISDLGISSEDDTAAHREKLENLREGLSEIREEFDKAEKEKQEVSVYYTTYLRQMQSDYEYILEKIRRENEELAENKKLLEEQQKEKIKSEREEEL